MNPYSSLPDKFFWAPAIAKKNFFDISELWDPRFNITPRQHVATFGSCFAQHFGRALKARGFNWMVAEQAPEGMSAETAVRLNYGIFTARTGNIYTASLLLQWMEWALGERPVPDEIWVKDGRYYDPFRPNIEPGGFASADELQQSRQMTLEAFRKVLTDCNVFEFTLGLTESWFNSRDGYEYPMCPGTVAGEYDANQHEFVNQSYPFIEKALLQAIRKIRSVNRAVRILLTVSPVPLTATMSGNHVLVATMESKSILRAVAGSVQKRFAFVDYFPSYEIINAPTFRGTFFEPNQRSVNHFGVEHVMKTFFEELARKFQGHKITTNDELTTRGTPGRHQKDSEDVVCEEILLASFARKG
jgi:GSCFA family